MAEDANHLDELLKSVAEIRAAVIELAEKSGANPPPGELARILKALKDADQAVIDWKRSV
jgi:hypothetical protein